MLIAIRAEGWTAWASADPSAIARYLIELARHIQPRRVSTSKRGPKVRKPYVDAVAASAHVSTARVLMQARVQRP